MLFVDGGVPGVTEGGEHRDAGERARQHGRASTRRLSGVSRSLAAISAIRAVSVLCRRLAGVVRRTRPCASAEGRPAGGAS